MAPYYLLYGVQEVKIVPAGTTHSIGSSSFTIYITIVEGNAF